VDSPAVVVAGSTAEAKGAVLGELLSGRGSGAAGNGVGSRVLDVPDESYLVLLHGERRAAQAFLPGARQPYPYPASTPATDGPVDPPPRPPRRVELCLPAPLLTGCTLVDSPAGGAFGLAYNRIVLDTARRGGALLFTLDAEVPPGQAELDFLAAAAQCLSDPRRVAHRSGPPLFFAVWTCGETADRSSAFRDVVISRVPSLAGAPWFLVTAGGGAADLEQALAGWAGREVGYDTVRRRVHTAVDGRESGWEEVLDRAVAAARDDVRQALTIELANLHQRCVQDIVFGGGCAGMPAALDRELHALSLGGADRVDIAITELTRTVLAHVLAAEAEHDVLRRVTDALRDRIEEDHPDLARVLLVTSTSGAVAAVPGTSAAGALAAYQTASWPSVLPPLGAGLSASCYQKWRDEKADADAAQAWLRAAVRGTEQELWRALSERFDVVRQVLNGLVADAVDHGLLLV
jgi:hypothetical protein